MTAAAELAVHIDVERMAALQSDEELWDLSRIADELGVLLVTVNAWRNKSLRYITQGQAVPIAARLLPAPDGPVSERRGRPQPRWTAGAIRTWAMRVGRMKPDGTARPLPQKGRPKRKPKTPVTLTCGHRYLCDECSGCDQCGCECQQ